MCKFLERKHQLPRNFLLQVKNYVMLLLKYTNNFLVVVGIIITQLGCVWINLLKMFSFLQWFLLSYFLSGQVLSEKYVTWVENTSTPHHIHIQLNEWSVVPNSYINYTQVHVHPYPLLTTARERKLDAEFKGIMVWIYRAGVESLWDGYFAEIRS